MSKTGLPAVSEILTGATPLLASTGTFLEQLNPILSWLSDHQQLTSDFISNGAAGLAAKTTSFGGGGTGHYLRQFSPVGPETLSFAANRDAAEFPDPDEIHYDRVPNRHIGFGLGPHRCIGIHLARLELKILLEELLARIPDMQVDHENVVRTGGLTRQVSHLPVTFTPGPRRGVST